MSCSYLRYNNIAHSGYKITLVKLLHSVGYLDVAQLNKKLSILTVTVCPLTSCPRSNQNFFKPFVLTYHKNDLPHCAIERIATTSKRACQDIQPTPKRDKDVIQPSGETGDSGVGKRWSEESVEWGNGRVGDDILFLEQQRWSDRRKWAHLHQLFNLSPSRRANYEMP